MEHIVSQVIISPIWNLTFLAAANAPPALVLDPVAKTFVVHAHVDDEIPCNKCGNGSLALPRPAPSAENLQMLHDANALDIALYAYAAERLDAHFAACFQR